MNGLSPASRAVEPSEGHGQAAGSEGELAATTFRFPDPGILLVGDTAPDNGSCLKA